MTEEFNWGKVDIDRLNILIREYLKRLEEEERNCRNLEEKSRWVLSITLPLSVLIIGYTFSLVESASWWIIFSSGSLGIVFAISALCAALAVLPREYKGESLIPIDSMVEWSDMIYGGEKGLIIFHKTRVIRYKEAIKTNTASNKKNSKWLSIALKLATVYASIVLVLILISILMTEWALFG